MSTEKESLAKGAGTGKPSVVLVNDGKPQQPEQEVASGEELVPAEDEEVSIGLPIEENDLDAQPT